jgi:hypothetical protein
MALLSRLICGRGCSWAPGVLAPGDAVVLEPLKCHLPHEPPPLLLCRVDSAAFGTQAAAGEEGAGGGGTGRVDDEAEDSGHVLRRVDERHALLEVRAGRRAVAKVDGRVARAPSPGHGSLALACRLLEARYLVWIWAHCRRGAPAAERITGGVANGADVAA